MTELIVTVGLPCSGKSTWAKEFAEQEYERTGFYTLIVESDEYRKSMYGSAEIQGNNAKLFELIHKDIIEFLTLGTSVILDATNLSYKHRKALLQKISKLNVHKTCILFATQYEICIERNRKRERQVPEAIIKRMRENFNVPLYTEGWDEIEIIYNYNSGDYSISDYLNFAEEFNQENPNHSLSLGHHSTQVAEYMSENKMDDHIYLAALLHDCGKPATKVFSNMKGEPTDIAHYYNHDQVGAYESLFYLNENIIKDKDILFASGLINFHMRPYFAKTHKAKKKLLNTVGEDMYYFLKMLNEADRKAH